MNEHMKALTICLIARRDAAEELNRRLSAHRDVNRATQPPPPLYKYKYLIFQYFSQLE